MRPASNTTIAEFTGSLRLTTATRRVISLYDEAEFTGSVVLRRPGQLSMGHPLGVAQFIGSIGSTISGRGFGSFKDFAHYADTLPDPAKIIVVQKASGLSTYDAAAPSGMRRVWVTTTPPLDYKVSDGYAWRRAAFASVGVRVNAMQAGSYQFVDGVQVEATPQGQSGPTNYAPARSLNVKVHPDRLNWCPNPRLGVDATGYGSSATTKARVAQGSGWAYSIDPSAGGSLYGPAAAGAPGQFWAARFTISGPIGKTVTIRLHDGTAYLGDGVPVVLTGAPQEVTLSSTIETVGSSPRPYVYYTPADFTAGQRLTLTNIVMEKQTTAGGKAGPYFDGASGEDYLWEGAGTPDLTRAYYYRDRVARAYLLNRLLEENCPLGTVPAVPQFAVLPAE